MALPYRTTGSLKPTFVSARLVGLAVNLVYAFALVGLISKQPEPSFARLRYRLGGDRPSQTTRLPLSLSRGKDHDRHAIGGEDHTNPPLIIADKGTTSVSRSMRNRSPPGYTSKAAR